MNRYRNLLALLCIITIGWFTVVFRYSYPAAFFWDENYHIAAAQKYLNGVFFMEPHPPLGKLLIALGEYIRHPNPETTQFLGTDHAPSAPQGFSFAGYRLFPVLLAWLALPLMYLAVKELCGSVFVAFSITLLATFDNALLVHVRGAMLEGPQIFFFVLTVYAALRIRRAQDRQLRYWAAVLGAAFAALMTIKVNGLIALVFFPVAFWKHRRAPLSCLPVAAAAFLLVYAAVWQIHFSLGKRINPNLPSQGFYQASAPVKALLQRGEAGALRSFPLMLQDSLRFVRHYQRGVPRLNLCKKDENGSPAYLWPVGARTINYRWERKEGRTRYLYLVSNPAGWALSLLGVIGAGVMCMGSFLRESVRPLRDPAMLMTLLSGWSGYMLMMLLLTRVMYLYHYFIPLLLGWLLLALVLQECEKFGRLPVTNSVREAFVGLGTIVAVLVFSFFAPLTYYQPLTPVEMAKRSWLSVWDLRCENCPRMGGIAIPLPPPQPQPQPSSASQSTSKAPSGPVPAK